MFICEVCQGTYSKLITHHIQSKSHGGTSKRNNLTKICAQCHMLVHDGKIVIEKKVMTTVGIKVIWRIPETETITGCLPQVYVMKQK